ncbi:MAG: hypothetical protein O2888_00120 [Chloroflexi bacterium]|nr:hypothetical protein [Chloroflexota bacterium]
MLEQVALSIAGKKLITLAAGGTLAASAAVYSQADLPGSSVGLEQTLRPIVAEFDLGTLLPSIGGGMDTTTAVTTEAATSTEGHAGLDLGLHAPVAATATVGSQEASVSLRAAGEATTDESGTTADTSSAEASGYVQTEVQTEATAALDVSTGVATITTEVATEVEGALGLDAALR